MVGHWVHGYLESCGLVAQDVPGVVAAFVGAKYATMGTCLVVGVRYQPLRRLFVRRKHVYSLLGRVRVRLGQQQALSSRRAAAGAAGAGNGNVQRAFEVARGQYREAKRTFLPVLRERAGEAREQMRSAKENWQAVGRQRAQNRQLQQHQRMAIKRHEEELKQRRGLWGAWYGWTSEQYWRLSDKLQATAQRSRLWSAISGSVGGDPRLLALGIAEGLILAKVTFPFLAPLELWIIVTLFKRRRASFPAATAAADDVVASAAAGAATPPAAADAADAAGPAEAAAARGQEEHDRGSAAGARASSSTQRLSQPLAAVERRRLAEEEMSQSPSIQLEPPRSLAV
eukprot:TRINITY_DN54510_c0_g1_i1.p1 TRINITY_DN54510_c0_g1~~TRINITY_DN54510_c0_g1_i1.p1  ORF type:complete len:342 (-),score=93.52 TRINITY_DN54510_c0_g1_i1:3-1028(-)